MELFSQFDTIALKKMVADLTTEREHIEFWDYIHHRDQDMMKSNAKEKIDQENLIMVSYYVNRFGYPDRSYLGRKSSILSYVWIHVTSFGAKRIAFPIILKGFVTGHIPEKNLREYYLRVMYQRLYDDSGNMTKPLRELFKELGVSIENTINIGELVSEFETFNDFMASKKETIGIWKSADIHHTSTFQGQPFNIERPGQKVIIFKAENGKIFFTAIYPKAKPDPVELIPLEDKVDSYQEKHRSTDQYYQILPEGHLVYLKADGSVKAIYYRM